ncbi:hypothetical protein [Hydrogenophaga sp. BPS33]|uniref:hypothetical protein n=1 Tax=Hydrogenophaga sp. BPS33 TaxID=2651974 RepID=UPI00131FC97F|nr:hypothetical protein [Hydrogenophaga sp. BPS33]QHE87739.1 hypothetical protein F9K07_23995 [Hydrogenophaga sp. BPS33]
MQSLAEDRFDPGVGKSVFRGRCPRFAKGKLVPIVLISESLLRRSSVTDGRILRDRVLSGLRSSIANSPAGVCGEKSGPQGGLTPVRCFPT